MSSSSGSLATGAGEKVFRFSTDDLPERDRLAKWREEFGRRIVRCEFEPLGSRFYANMTIRATAGFSLMSAEHSATRAERTRGLVADGDDLFLLQISKSAGLVSQLGRETMVGPSDAILVSSADTAMFTFPSEQSRCLLMALSRARLRPMLRDMDAALMRRVVAAAPALQLLTGYIRSWMETSASTLDLEQLAVGHIYDLAAHLLEPTRDAAEAGRHGGVRAAQLGEAKDYVLSKLADSMLSVDSVARHLGVTPRYIHMLFETEAELFSEFVLAQRLIRAHAILLDPRFADTRISAIALDSGFGDLSYFNRTFRRRFQTTPSAARNKIEQR